MGEAIKVLRLTADLLATRDTFKDLYGEIWPAKSAEFQPLIQQLMATNNTDNPLSAVLLLAKEMSAQGRNPLMLIAAAVDMSEAK